MHASDVTETAARPEGARGWPLAVTAGILGWVLDAFDFFIVIFLLDALSAHFGVRKAQVVETLTVTLAMRPVGALLFGALADRFGRKVPLIVCVLYFSATSVMSGLAPSFAWFIAMRGLYGLGMGGYWGIGASYAMESAPRRLRGVLSGLMQSGYPIGYLVAAVVLQFVTVHWQRAFFVGVPVALLIAILTAVAPESEAWQRQRAGSLGDIGRALWSHRGIFAYLLVLMGVMLCLSHGTQDLYPDFLKTLPGITAQTIAGMKTLYAIPVLYNVAAVVAALIFGQVSERVGRRRAMMLALVVSLVSIPAWAFGRTVGILVLGSCLMQAGAQGAWGVIPAHINELSPGSVRGLFPGLVYQLGVLLASPAAQLEYWMRDRLGYSWALTWFEIAVIALLLILFGAGPERLGREFAEQQRVEGTA